MAAQSFGVNIAKLREIIQFKPESVTKLPDSAPSILGTLLLRDSTIQIIDLVTHLGFDRVERENQRPVILICEFNEKVYGFLVDGVGQIYRCSWQDISPLSPLIDHFGASINSSITIDNTNVLVVDMEHVVVDVFPQSSLIYSNPDSGQAEIAVKKCTVREDVKTNRCRGFEDCSSQPEKGHGSGRLYQPGDV